MKSKKLYGVRARGDVSDFSLTAFGGLLYTFDEHDGSPIPANLIVTVFKIQLKLSAYE